MLAGFFHIFVRCNDPPMKNIRFGLCIPACLFALFCSQQASPQGYVKLNVPYALVGVVNPAVEFAISPKSTLQTDIVISPWKSINEKHMLFAIFMGEYRRYFKEALELEILEQGYPADKAVLYEILELLVETVTSRKKFLRICGEEKPKEVVKSRLMKLDSSHIQYILECLKENSTQIRNIKQYLLATLYNAPVTVDSYYSAQVRHEFGWGSRVDKN